MIDRVASRVGARIIGPVDSFIPEKLYHQFIAGMPLACVDVAIVDHGSVLLVKRKDSPARGQWWVPGGRVWKGEMLRETAARKAREEVGIECHIGPIIHTAETIFPDGPAGIDVHSINACFFAYPVSQSAKARLDDHHAGHKWVREIPKGLHPYVLRCLQAAGLEPASKKPARRKKRA